MKTKLYAKKVLFIIVLIIIIISIFLFLVNKYLSTHKKENKSNFNSNQGEVYVSQNSPEKFITNDGYEYYVLNDNNEKIISITKYSGKDENIIIPKTINNYKVEYISDSAFAYCNNIKTVTINENIVSIGVCCFGGCENLENIIILGTKTEIGYECFINCSKLTIQCKENSNAEIFSKENNISYKIIN